MPLKPPKEGPTFAHRFFHRQKKILHFQKITLDELGNKLTFLFLDVELIKNLGGAVALR